MSVFSRRISMLILKHLRGEITFEETTELHDWLESSEQNQALFDLLTQEDTLRQELREYSNAHEEIWDKITTRIREQKVVQLRRRKPWKYIAAAAAVLLILLSGIYFLTGPQSSKAITQVPDINHSLTLHDIVPAGNKATLTLGNGSVIALDSMQNGTLATEKGTHVVKMADGQIVYRGSDQSAETNESDNNINHTISTPKGGHYHLVLSDGTAVWLNAASSISYPVVFTGTERTVSITGEAYFEVNPLPSSRGSGEKVPFNVKILSASGKETGKVQVLGTHFNINAYNDEAVIRTTLLEGKVKIIESTTHQSKFLEPGQQATISPAKDENRQVSLSTSNSVDLDAVMAWKNGIFYFKSAGIETIMREAKRWYDIDVLYNKKPTDKFTGKISREVTLEAMLRILQYSGVKFSLEDGRKLVISED